MLHPTASTTRKRAIAAAAEDVLTVIEAEARAVALAFGASAPDAVAAALVDRLLVRIGGAPLYLPRTDPRKRARQHAAIRAQFDGKNHVELARSHELSVRRVRQILKAPVR